MVTFNVVALFHRSLISPGLARAIFMTKGSRQNIPVKNDTTNAMTTRTEYIFCFPILSSPREF